MRSCPKIVFQIITGDALSVLDDIKANSVQMVYTSPNPPFKLEEKAQIVTVLNKCKRVLTSTGTVFLELGDYYTESGSIGLIPEGVILMLRANGWLVRNKLYWKRTEHYKQLDRQRFRVNIEYLYMLALNMNHYFNDKLGIQDSSLIEAEMTYPKPGEFKSGFPEKLIDIPIRVATKPGDTVLDPYCGTGTTGVVALKNKRNFIGIEQNIDNYDLLINRLNKFDQP